MNELFLQFVWQHQFFSKVDLQTVNGESIVIYHQGFWNKDQGPDFTQARIQIDEIEWHGSVELHIKSSDWIAHHHDNDQGYDSVILHVVWEMDREIYRTNAAPIPTLCLQHLISVELLEGYKKFSTSKIQLPCANFSNERFKINFRAMLDRVMIERVERKSKEIIGLVETNQGNWNEALWIVVVKSFGCKINNDAFEQLARAIPYSIVSKHTTNFKQLEALLFGQAGLLEGEAVDSYFEQLQKEFQFLSAKYGLQDKQMAASQWKFLRTRVNNFPTVRIAQLAALLLYNGLPLIEKLLTVRKSVDKQNRTWPLSAYWKEHYLFGKKNIKGHNRFTESFLDNLFINAIFPYKVARSLNGFAENSIEQNLTLLEAMPLENNKITREWLRMGLLLSNAFDSQAAIELYSQYCLKRKCLYCTIGTSIVYHLNGNHPYHHSNSNTGVSTVVY